MAARAETVCGIDVGSQGSCLAVFDAAGERLATTYQPHPLSYPRPGWAEQDPRDWRAALVNGFRDLSARRQPPPRPRDLVRVAARRAGVRRRERAARRPGDHLDGPARRTPCAATSSSGSAPIAGTRPAAATWTARTSPPRSPGCGPSARTSTPAPTATCSPAPTWRALPVARTPSTARMRRPPCCSTPTAGTGTASWSMPGRSSPTGCRRWSAPRRCWAPSRRTSPRRPDCRRDCLVVCGCGRRDGRDARRRGRRSRGRSATSWARPSRCARSSDRPLRDPSRIAECHPHAAPGRWLLENPGWAERRELPLVPRRAGRRRLLRGAERARRLGAGRVATAWCSCRGWAAPWRPAGRPTRAAAWYGLTPAHGRGHLLPVAARGLGLRASATSSTRSAPPAWRRSASSASPAARDRRSSARCAPT